MEEKPKPYRIVVGQKVSEGKALVARAMRRDMTPAERALWRRLRNNQLRGLHFRRQQIVDGFIADFYCHESALVVEVDGPIHDAGYDQERDRVFAARGISVLRFKNEEVLQQMDQVIEQIAEETERSPAKPLHEGSDERSIPSSSPSPMSAANEAGEGAGGERSTRLWDAAHVMKTYARQPVTFVRGQGTRLWDANGKEYLDFLAGIAVCSVGHCHPHLVRAIQEQAATLMHVSNLYLTEPQARLARRLVELSDHERVFFCNSGAEANEAAIKIARKRAKQIGSERKVEIVTAHNSFHGRTLATVTATGQPKYQKGFEPLPGGFSYVPFNEVEALRAAVNENTAAILLEPIQGEGGILPATPEYLRAARELADRHDALLIFDEVQTGMGRTGQMWAYQHYGVVPDVFTLAKGLGGGFPIGACLARGDAAETFVPGDHGSTFAGNPVAAAAANAVLDVIADEDLRENARRMGERLTAAFQELRRAFPHTVGPARGVGLMLALGLTRPVAKQIVTACLEAGLIVNAIGDDTIRLLPPLILSEDDADRAVNILGKVIATLA